MTSKVLKRVSLAATGFTVATLSLSGVASAASISNTGPGSYNSISFGGSNWGGKYSSSQHDYSHKDNKNDKKNDYKNVVKYVVKYDNKDEHKDYHKDKKDDNKNRYDNKDNHDYVHTVSVHYDKPDKRDDCKTWSNWDMQQWQKNSNQWDWNQKHCMVQYSSWTWHPASYDNGSVCNNDRNDYHHSNSYKPVYVKPAVYHAPVKHYDNNYKNDSHDYNKDDNRNRDYNDMHDYNKPVEHKNNDWNNGVNNWGGNGGSTTTTTVQNNNRVNVDNDNHQTATTGNATVSHNTWGGNATTGDATNENSTSTNVSITNSAPVSTMTSNDWSGNSWKHEDRDTTRVTNNNTVNVSNSNTQTARSGNATVSYNTHGGDATSGNASNYNSTETNININN